MEIYASKSEAYHKMISPEDLEGNLQTAIQEIVSIKSKRIIDLGTGTGRIPLLFWEQADQVIGLDLYLNMLEQNQVQRDAVQGRWHLIMADMRMNPLPTAWADVVTAGWAIGHLRGWYPQDWQLQIDKILQEMHRVVKPGGWILIMETLTTGSFSPAPPTPELEEYYLWLEQTWGFGRRSIRTDYQFANVDEAVSRTEFFFGTELSQKIRQQGWSRIPEWTGIWSKKIHRPE